MNLKEQLDMERIPEHIAIIMDGNGRWAQQQGKARIFGHKIGVQAVRETVEAAAELGVSFLTLYTFSTENWNRPAIEVTALMTLLVNTIQKELPTLRKNRIRLTTIGDMDSLPPDCKAGLEDAMRETKDYDRMTLVLALSYSAKWEIINAVKSIAQSVKNAHLDIEDIDEDIISNALTTSGMPDPELLIRTSGETRISNFLLWQIAYSELYFTEVFWPDFREEHLYRAIIDYQQRERRFGKTGDQMESS